MNNNNLAHMKKWRKHLCDAIDDALAKGAPRWMIGNILENIAYHVEEDERWEVYKDPTWKPPDRYRRAGSNGKQGNIITDEIKGTKILPDDDFTI